MLCNGWLTSCSDKGTFLSLGVFVSVMLYPPPRCVTYFILWTPAEAVPAAEARANNALPFMVADGWMEWLMDLVGDEVLEANGRELRESLLL